MAQQSFILAHASEIAIYSTIALVTYKAFVYIQRLYFCPLSKFPGPKICSASRIYEFYWDAVQHGRFWTKLPELHQKYGPIVRIGPNEIHIDDPEYFDVLFGFRPLRKEAMTAKAYGMRHAMFATEDYKLYTKKRAAFGDAFSRSKALKLQDMINGNIDEACAWIQGQMEKGGVVDLAYIFRAVPAEIITEYFFGVKYGFISDEETTKGLYNKKFDNFFGLTNLGRFMPYQIPLYGSLIRQMTKLALGFKEPGSAWMSWYFFAQKLVKKVVEEHKNPTSWTTDRKYPNFFEDFLDSSLPPEEKEGSIMAEHAMTIWSGGWDTVGFTLTITVYHVLRNPQMLQRLQEELKEAWSDSSAAPPAMSVLDKLPYFNAVLKEGFRHGPGALSRLGRVNPTGTEQYKEWTIPAGTIINMSLPDVHADKAIWGSDVEVFRPERWLGRSDLDRYLVTFSKGSRVCPGIELAWVEFRLFLSTLFRRFDMRILPETNMTDDDVVAYYDGFTPAPKNWTARLAVAATPLA